MPNGHRQHPQFAAADHFSCRQPQTDIFRSNPQSSADNHDARLVARLHHPHIVDVYAAGTNKEHVFFAMEHVAGQTAQEPTSAGTRKYMVPECRDAVVPDGSPAP